MQDEIKLGIPDDERTAAPQSRFRLGERKGRLISRLLGPFTLAAWGALAAKLVGEDTQSHAKDADKSDPARPGGTDAHSPSHDAAALSPQDTPPARHAAPQVVPLHDFRVWRSPEAMSFDLATFASHRAGFPSDNFALFHQGDAIQPMPHLPAPHLSSPHSRTSALPANFLPADDAPLVYHGTTPPPHDKPVVIVPPKPPKAHANARPTIPGPVQLGRGVRNESMLLSALVLLSGATDADGDTLSIAGLTTDAGSIAAHGHGVWLFSPAHDLTGPIEIHYSITDGTAFVAQTAQINLLVPSGLDIHGTSADDSLIGTPLSDVIVGLDGDDLIYAREGDDVVDGGNGNDRIIGGDGNDVLHGGAGDDHIFGGAGNDNIFGGAGNDTIDAGDGNDFVDGGAGNDIIYGGAGNDMILGGAGDDNFTGGDGADVIDLGSGSDTVDAGAGDDRIALTTFDGTDQFDGGTGNDTIDLSPLTGAVVVDLLAGSISSVDLATGMIVISAIENVIAGSGNDTIIADAKVNLLVGGAGDDLFVFHTLDSLQNGGAGHDVIGDFQAGDRIGPSETSDRLNAYAAVKLFFDGNGSDVPQLGAVWFMFDDDVAGGQTIISGHVALSDNHSDEDFSIDLVGHQSITNANFIFQHQALLASI